MLSYKELGLVNTRAMFAAAVKGGYVNHKPEEEEENYT
jgi:hypothetical protein